VLAHEATHLRGVRYEAETECYALQEGVELGRQLGLDTGTARALMRAQRDQDLSDESVQRSTTASRKAAATAGRSICGRTTRASPSCALPLRQRLFQPAPHERDAGAGSLLTQRRCRQGVCLQHDLLPLALEPATNHEERRMGARPPLVDLGE